MFISIPVNVILSKFVNLRQQDFHLHIEGPAIRKWRQLHYTNTYLQQVKIPATCSKIFTTFISINYESPLLKGENFISEKGLILAGWRNIKHKLAT